MKFAAILSTEKNAGEVVKDIQEQLKRSSWPENNPSDLVFLFASAHFTQESEELVSRIFDIANASALIGCTGESIIGGSREVEGEPAVSLWLARLPEVKVTPFALSTEEVSQGVDLKDWPSRLGISVEEKPSFILMAEPFTCDVMNLLEGLNATFPGRPTIGGISSAGGAGENRLFFNGQVNEEGLVGAALSGNLLIETVVSQGCRPIGRPVVVTKANRNLIVELGGVPAVQCFKEAFESLSDEDKALVRNGLHVGRVINEYQEGFNRGDFLIRNVIGADQRTGAIAITDRPRVGQTIQFHVRDARTAGEDLSELLDLERSASGGSSPEAALLFSCNGRGSRMFPGPNHDASLVQQKAGPIPLSGFFAGGEIGPIGDKNFLHGFTASLAIFRPRISS